MSQSMWEWNEQRKTLEPNPCFETDTDDSESTNWSLFFNVMWVIGTAVIIWHFFGGYIR